MRAMALGLLAHSALALTSDSSRVQRDGSSLQPHQLAEEEHLLQEQFQSSERLLFRAPQQPVAFVHTPKCGGTSLLHLLNTSRSMGDFDSDDWFNPNKPGRWEQCRSQLQTDTNFVVTMVRYPRAHVLSQYLECRYDTWGKSVTTDIFPRNGDEATDFASWLAIFTNGWNNATGDCHCYNPWNMQARALTCEEPKWYQPRLSSGISPTELYPASATSSVHHLWADGIRDREPGVVRTLSALEEVHFVGVLELFEESWCMLEYQGAKLPESVIV